MKKYFAIIVFMLVAVMSFSQFLPDKPNRLVNDYAQVMTESQRQSLENDLRAYANQTTVQIAVVTVPNINGFGSIDEYANKLFRHWGIGQAGTNNGLLVVNAISERKVRIEVGYGLEGWVTDMQAGSIINTMKPLLKKSDYYGAYVTATNQLKQSVGTMSPEERKQSEAIAKVENDKKSAEARESFGTFFMWVLFVVLAGGAVFGIYWVLDTPARKLRQAQEAERVKKQQEEYAKMLAENEKKYAEQRRVQAEYDKKHPKPKVKPTPVSKTRKKDDDSSIIPAVIIASTYSSPKRDDDSHSSWGGSSDSGFGGFGGGDSGGGGASGDY